MADWIQPMMNTSHIHLTPKKYKNMTLEITRNELSHLNERVVKLEAADPPL